MIDSVAYPSIREFAFLPPRALDSFKDLSGESGTNYEIMHRINLDYQAAISEDATPRTLDFFK